MSTEKKLMKSFLLKKGGGIELRQMPVPKVNDFDVLVRITHSSVCGTDYQIIHWDSWTQENEIQEGIILGHEGAGIVEKIGSKVTKVKPGDFVSMESHYVEHNDNPKNEGIIGIWGPKDLNGKKTFPRGGTYAEFCCNDEKSIYKLSDKLRETVHASLLEPAGNGWKVAKYILDSGIKENVVIFGSGLHGTNLTLFLKDFGIKNIILVEPDETRRKFAEKFNAVDYILNPLEKDFMDKVLKICSNSVNCVVDMAGPKPVFDAGVKLLKNNGIFVLFGLPKEANREVSGKNLSEVIFSEDEFDSTDYGKKIHFRGITGRSHKGWLELISRLEESEFLRKKISETLTEVIPMEELAEKINKVDKHMIKLGMNGFR
ncbi:MAG: alcohol dehydrogenase catalytic domain-containing protein [Candidatus Diapherotrites archaeon]|nr:alcohol dehydrogenase catalytic domain-containing protein [Candidatus Diapherotrites archaeon]